MQSCQCECEWEWETVALFFHSNFTFDVAFVRRGQLLICCSPASLLLLFYANLVAAEREAAAFRWSLRIVVVVVVAWHLTVNWLSWLWLCRVTCEQQQNTLKARVVMYTDLSLNLMPVYCFTCTQNLYGNSAYRSQHKKSIYLLALTHFFTDAPSHTYALSNCRFPKRAPL